MRMEQVIDGAREMITVKRVFGEPIERDGLTIIPAATVQGGGGGGGGEGPDGQGKGEGGGFGLSGRPSGAYVIAEGRVTWHPVVDVSRLASVAGAVTIVAFLSLRSIAKAKYAKR